MSKVTESIGDLVKKQIALVRRRILIDMVEPCLGEVPSHETWEEAARLVDDLTDEEQVQGLRDVMRAVVKQATCSECGTADCPECGQCDCP